MKMILILSVILLLNRVGSSAQNYRDDIERIRVAYSTGGNMSANIAIRYYENYSSNKETDSLMAHIDMYGSYYDYKMENYEYLKNRDYYVIVDRRQKAVLVRHPGKMDFSPMSFEKIDSFMKANNVTTTYSPLNHDMGLYKIKFTGGDFNEVDFSFSRKTFLIQRVVLYYNKTMNTAAGKTDKPRVEFVYSGYNTSFGNSSNFSEGRFFSFNGNKIKLSGNYSGYKLLNYLTQ